MKNIFSGASVRTIYRDIQALSEVGVPIIGIPGTGYSLMEGYFLPPVSFTVEEACIPQFHFAEKLGVQLCIKPAYSCTPASDMLVSVMGRNLQQAC
jgi:hypothetical protein